MNAMNQDLMNVFGNQPVAPAFDHIRIAIASPGDADFNGAGGEFGAVNFGTTLYELVVRDAGSISLGGAVANGGDVYAPRLWMDAPQRAPKKLGLSPRSLDVVRLGLDQRRAVGFFHYRIVDRR